MEWLNEGDNEEDGKSISHWLASLFLHMETILREFTNRSIEKVLREHNCNTDNTVLTVVRETLQESNPLLLLKMGPFGIDCKRSLFFRNNFRHLYMFPFFFPFKYIYKFQRSDNEFLNHLT